MKKLHVFFEDKKVGTLKQNKDLIYSFAYSDEWIENKDAFPISLVMPLKKEAIVNKITLSFFENLLPKGAIRSILE